MDSNDKEDLKIKAEKLINSGKVFHDKNQYDDINQVVEELLIYQAELQAQNEELLETQACLEQSQQKFADLFNLSPLIYIIVDNAYRVTEVNQKGYISFRLESIHRYKKNFCSLLDPKYITDFFTWMKSDDEYLEVVFVGKTEPFWGRLKKKLYHFGVEDEILITINDITQEKKLQEALEKQISKQSDTISQQELLIEQQEKSALLGNMINSILHQWKQPLNIISMICMKNKHKAKEKEKITISQKDIEMVENQIDYMAETSSAFRMYFNPNQIGNVFSILSVISNAEKLLHHRFQFQLIDLQKQINSEIFIKGLESDFMQVILNIFNNIFDAFEEKEIHKQKIMVNTFYNNNKCTLQIKDTAGGIDQSLLPQKIFEQYTTTKKEEKGTGIGMYITKRILEEKFHATIDVYNSHDGAVIDIELPVIIQEREKNA